MKFIVSSALLLKELQKLGGVINSANTLPILDNFLFEAQLMTITAILSKANFDNFKCIVENLIVF